MIFLSRDFSPLENWVFFAIKLINFDRELLSSQTTHRNGLVLFGILRTLLFHRVQAHFSGSSVSRAIRDKKLSILWQKTPNFRGGKNRDLKKSYFIFYKFNQGLVFCKHPNFQRRKSFIRRKNSNFFLKFHSKNPKFFKGGQGVTPKT